MVTTAFEACAIPSLTLAGLNDPRLAPAVINMSVTAMSLLQVYMRARPGQNLTLPVIAPWMQSCAEVLRDWSLDDYQKCRNIIIFMVQVAILAGVEPTFPVPEKLLEEACAMPSFVQTAWDLRLDHAFAVARACGDCVRGGTVCIISGYENGCMACTKLARTAGEPHNCPFASVSSLSKSSSGAE